MSELNVYQKLNKVQTELKAPKNQFNSFGKYKYRSCEDILEALKPILAEVKAVVIVSDEMVQVGDRIYVKSTVRFIDTVDGKEVVNSALAREEENKKGMDSSQLTGSTSSYSRKYCLNGMFLIDDTKDSDATNTHDKEDKPNNKNSDSEITDAQIKRVYAIGNKANITPKQIIETINKSYNKTDLKTLTKAEYDEVVKRLESKIN